MLGMVLAVIIVEGNARERDRIIARYVLCRELESVKHAQRLDLTAKIRESEEFLEDNPMGIPGVPALNATVIRRGIRRNERLRASLAPYPRGCAAFARDPTKLHVDVPEVKE
jgi:hypothetical protein